MKTSPVTTADLQRSVLAVPPLCRRPDLALDEAANRAMVAHLRGGGVTTHLWGGNANLYNMGTAEFAPFLDMAERLAEDEEWAIPSVGAEFGKALDQIDSLRERPFPTAMLLPLRFPATPAGTARGLGLLAERYRRPLIAYVKDDGHIDPADLARLMRDGALCAVKYGTVRAQPHDDPALAAIVDAVGPERVISGIGERPVLDHVRHFRLRAFTSGSVCVAPRLSTVILHALQRGDLAAAEATRALFLPLEDLRDRLSPLRVLHEAVHLAGIADTGPILPMLSNITDGVTLAAIREAATSLRALDGQATLGRAA